MFYGLTVGSLRDIGVKMCLAARLEDFRDNSFVSRITLRHLALGDSHARLPIAGNIRRGRRRPRAQLNLWRREPLDLLGPHHVGLTFQN